MKEDQYVVWEESLCDDGSVTCKVVDVFDDALLATELCRWDSKYSITKVERRVISTKK